MQNLKDEMYILIAHKVRNKESVEIKSNVSINFSMVYTTMQKIYPPIIDTIEEYDSL